MCVYSEIFMQAQEKALEVELSNPELESAVIVRKYDATPILTYFGALQEQLLPWARYFFKDEDTGNWRTIPLKEYKQRYRSTPKKGVVELFAQHATVHVRIGGGARRDWEMIFAPAVLRNGKAGCIFDAVEAASKVLSIEGITRLAQRLRFCILAECPDKATSNVRKKAATKERLPKNVLYLEDECRAHGIHRIATTAIRETEIVGHIFALQFIVRLAPHYSRLLRAFITVVEDDIDGSHVGEPPPAHLRSEWEENLSTILDHTFLRNQMISGRTHAGEYKPAQVPDWRSKPERKKAVKETSDPSKPCLQALGNVRKYVNCNINGKLGHYCWTENCSCRNVQDRRVNVYHALVNAGVFLGSSDSSMVSTARWGSTTKGVSGVSAGILICDVMQRAAERAYPNWDAGRLVVIRPEVEDYDDDYQKKVMKKTWRFVRYISNNILKRKTVIICFTSGPLDHLLMRLQHLDEGDVCDISYVTLLHTV